MTMEHFKEEGQNELGALMIMLKPLGRNQKLYQQFLAVLCFRIFIHDRNRGKDYGEFAILYDVRWPAA